MYGEQVGATLYGLGKNDQKLEWKVFVEDATITCEYGQVNGKKRTQVTVAKGKNVGRSNETTDHEQAILEAQSKWRKKYDSYYRESVEEIAELETMGVMLAENYVKKPHLANNDIFVSRKLNGVRCKSVLEDGFPRLYSRGNINYPTPPHLVQPLIDAHVKYGHEQLDGELYVHGYPLGRIQSASKVTTELTPLLEFHIFDIPCLSKPFVMRLEMMLEMKDLSNGVYLVEYEKATVGDLVKIQDVYRSEGYEGVMIRNYIGKYLFRNQRSNDLLKYKLFQDSEAKVISVTEDKLGEGILTCEWKDGILFECKMTGTHEYRSYTNMLTLIGEWINFTYSEPTEKGIPEFPVGRYVRHCDENGNPLE